MSGSLIPSKVGMALRSKVDEVRSAYFSRGSNKRIAINIPKIDQIWSSLNFRLFKDKVKSVRVNRSTCFEFTLWKHGDWPYAPVLSTSKS